jgi:hypothetical protein
MNIVNRKSPKSPKSPKSLAKKLDVSVVRLRRREIQLIKELGVRRVEKLRLFFRREMTPRQADALRRSMDWSDKELVWLWKLIEWAHHEQLGSWREAALSGSPGPGPESANGANWPRGRRRGRVGGRVNPQTLERIIGV